MSLRVPFSLALQGQVTLTESAEMAKSHSRGAGGASGGSQAGPTAGRAALPRWRAEETEASEMAWQHRKQSQKWRHGVPTGRLLPHPKSSWEGSV